MDPPTEDKDNVFEGTNTLLSRTRIREFLAFTGGSAVGLAIDLVGFQVLVFAGFAPWQANAISSTVSISAVYVLVTRYSFRVVTRFWTYALFAAWYGASILTFSTLIQVAVDLTGWQPLAWKLLAVPLSFGLNYLFSRFLFGRREQPGERDSKEMAAPISQTP